MINHWNDISSDKGLMFPHRAPPGSLSSLTADRCPPPVSLLISPLTACSSTAPRTRLLCLDGTASPWTQSPPTPAIPTTPDAPGDPTGMGSEAGTEIATSPATKTAAQKSL
ncbi:hypothetical protein CesoFtcFv8_027700 [Champsocephalus esox]|uniref:Uncharacterized protein n=1 Tax=Champsocephalus esox TaxID=159716 RepID=A0AAN8AYE0_9TELE|nr:hypothetical protein CesoFtcFv8_027700 [Champsocephalus esox]